MNIPFHKTYYDESELQAVRSALIDGVDYTEKVRGLLKSRYHAEHLFLTNGASAAFDLLFSALGLPRGSEVILPSFTYPSAANTLLRHGLMPVFADIDENTLVLDIADVQRRIGANTRAVVPTHYGGASVDLEALRAVCGAVPIFEDAALSFGAKYKSRPLGAFGQAGVVSFHHTKNISAGQGGLLIVHDNRLAARLQTLLDNGTNKAAFLRGKVDAYTWQSAGYSAAMPDLAAAVLFAQLQKAGDIANRQKTIWQHYFDRFSKRSDVTVPAIPDANTNNHHVFYLRFQSNDIREKVRMHLESCGISAHFHYMPLHASPMGQRLGYRPAELPVTTRVSACMLRLPIYSGLALAECESVADCVLEALDE